MDDLKITYNDGHGQMIIHMNFFFPCSQERFKKLLKIIDLDWQHKEQHIENLKVHFQKRIADLSDLRKENGKIYFDNKQKAADTQTLIDSRKHPNGLPVSKDELKQARADLKEYKATAKKALSDANQNLKFKQRFEKYLELL